MLMDSLRRRKTLRGVGVLRMEVPRSTCWKAQLRPIFIDTTSSSSTPLRTRRAQDPRGGASREEVQDRTREGLFQALAEHHRLIKDSYASFITKEPAPGKGETWPAPLQAALHHQKGAACKGITASTFSSPIFPPASIPRHLYGGTIVFLFYSSGQVVFLLSTPVATPPSPLS